MSIQIAKLFEGGTPIWTGLTQKCYTPFLNSNSDEFKSVEKLIEVIRSNGFKIHTETPVEISKDAILFEMTGSPKPYGFKTKEEFTNLISAHGFVHSKLDKKCKYLITDDIHSTSSKMSSAKKLGVEIKTYEEILKMIK